MELNVWDKKDNSVSIWQYKDLIVLVLASTPYLSVSASKPTHYFIDKHNMVKNTPSILRIYLFRKKLTDYVKDLPNMLQTCPVSYKHLKCYRHNKYVLKPP